MKGLIISLICLSILFGASDIFSQKKPPTKKPKPPKTKPPSVVNTDWQQEFVSNEGRFKVLFPNAPTLKIIDEGKGDLRLKAVSYRAYSGTIGYGVTFTDSFSSAMVDNEKNLETLRNLILSSGKGVKETKLNLDGIAGWEIIYQKPDQSIAQHRVFSVGKRSYEIMTVYKPMLGEKPETAVERNKTEVGKFFNSFKLIK